MLGRSTGLLEVDQLAIQALDLTAEPFVARDHLVGVFARQVEIGIVHLEGKRRTLALMLFDLFLEIRALLFQSRFCSLCVPIRTARTIVASGPVVAPFRLFRAVHRCISNFAGEAISGDRVSRGRGH